MKVEAFCGRSVTREGRSPAAEIPNVEGSENGTLHY
jgi:hypothetical protein